MPNPRPDLQGFADPSTPGWQQAALARVLQRQKRTKRHTERKSGVLATFDDPFRVLLDEACRRRNISMQGYARRAIAAFVARDLGLTSLEVFRYMARPTAYRAEAGAGRPARTEDDGRGNGPWYIQELMEYED
jgi:hypothetical protein